MGALKIVFDQDCGVCQATVGWLKRHDRAGQFEFIGNQAAELPAGIERLETDETVFVVDESDGSIRSRADGVGKLLRTLPGWRALGWRSLGALILIPGLRQLANFGYGIFARHRHQVSAALGMNACAVPAAPIKK